METKECLPSSLPYFPKTFTKARYLLASRARDESLRQLQYIKKKGRALLSILEYNNLFLQQRYKTGIMEG